MCTICVHLFVCVHVYLCMCLCICVRDWVCARTNARVCVLPCVCGHLCVSNMVEGNHKTDINRTRERGSVCDPISSKPSDSVAATKVLMLWVKKEYPASELRFNFFLCFIPFFFFRVWCFGASNSLSVWLLLFAFASSFVPDLFNRLLSLTWFPPKPQRLNRCF